MTSRSETAVTPQRGFTLLEMMIVLAIMGGMLALAGPYLSNRNSQTNAVLRELAVLSRELHTKSKLQGVVFRLVIDMQQIEPGTGKRAAQSYWVERANGKTVLKLDEEAEVMRLAQDHKGEKQAPQDPRGFTIDKSIIKKPRQLPNGLTFDKIELSRVAAPITTGKAFIHYMPQGLVDEAAIHLRGEKGAAWTLSIHPLTGRAEVISKPISLQEIKSQ